MDLLAFFSGICVASVGFFVISRMLLKPVPPAPALMNELNRLHAKVDAVSKAPAARLETSPAILPLLHAHEKRAEVLADLYAKLVSLQRHLREAHVLQTADGKLFFGGREASERDIEQKLEREKAAFFEQYQQLAEFAATHRIYLDRAVSESVDPMLAAFDRMIAQSLTSGIFRRGGAASLTENIAQVATALSAVEATFKQLLGIENPAAA